MTTKSKLGLPETAVRVGSADPILPWTEGPAEFDLLDSMDGVWEVHVVVYSYLDVLQVYLQHKAKGVLFSMGQWVTTPEGGWEITEGLEDDIFIYGLETRNRIHQSLEKWSRVFSDSQQPQGF